MDGYTSNRMLYATTARTTTQTHKEHFDQHPHRDECGPGAAHDESSNQQAYHHHALKYSLRQNIILMFDGEFELSGSTASCSWFYPPNVIVSPHKYFALKRDTYRNGI